MSIAGTSCKEIDTPALLVDLDRLEANLAKMAGLARENNVALRPHTKTHKCPEIARMQLDKGAVGITCAKLSEAQVMADAGFDDILIANQIIGEQKLGMLLDLAGRTSVCIALDSEFGAASLHQALVQGEQTLEVMIEINCGQNRAGVLPGEPALKLATALKQFPRLNLRGLLTHGGHSYGKQTQEEIAEVGKKEGTVMVETADLLRRNGIAVDTVSVGSTPTAPYCSRVKGVTEMRPGTYVFYDLTQVNLYACRQDECALSVLATVTSRPSDSRAVIDAGKKALTSDPSVRKEGEQSGFGYVLGKDAFITNLSEEHGVIISDATFTIGEKVQILPNHVCVVVNMFDQMYGMRNDRIETVFEIAGRGKVL